MKFPIRIRLAVAYCAVFLVVIAALEAVSYSSVRAAIHNIVDHELETRLAGLDDHIARHLKLMSWPQLSEQLKTHPAFQPDLLRIEAQGKGLVFQGNGLHGIQTRAATPVAAIGTAGSASRSLRILTVSHRIDGDLYRLTLGTDLFFSARILSRLWLLMLLSLPLVLIVAGGAGYWISGHALGPVSGIIAAARSMDSAHLSDRIAVPGTGDEIQQLAETINGMLARIEDSFRSIRHFTANASHELRTPLAIIRATAEVALLGGGRAAREPLERILREAERNTVLLEDLLVLARADAEAGGLTVRAPQKPVDLRFALSSACSGIMPLAETHGLSLRVSLGERPLRCNADEEQLRRLWLILLDNAVKYTPAGGHIRAQAGLASDGRPWVEISDTGIGIAPEHRSCIFERFYRVDKARSRSQGGTGLGLAIARHIANSHGAVIEVFSEPGRGSRFRVLFSAAGCGELKSSGNAQVSVIAIQHPVASLDVNENVSA